MQRLVTHRRPPCHCQGSPAARSPECLLPRCPRCTSRLRPHRPMRTTSWWAVGWLWETELGNSIAFLFLRQCNSRSNRSPMFQQRRWRDREKDGVCRTQARRQCSFLQTLISASFYVFACMPWQCCWPAAVVVVETSIQMMGNCGLNSSVLQSVHLLFLMWGVKKHAEYYQPYHFVSLVFARFARCCAALSSGGLQE